MPVRKPQKDSKLPQLAVRNIPASSRLWILRITTALVAPIALFLMIELTLRLSNYGYDSSYFIEDNTVEPPMLMANEQFGRRFFPERMVRSPNPMRMTVGKPPNTTRIFVFGESAALGDPRPGYGFPRYLQVMLEERFPDQRFEVICTAMTAINSHAILPIARESAAFEGDLWIVYMGNNEMVGPFGATPVFGQSAQPLPIIRASIFMQSFRIFQGLQSIKDNLLTSGNKDAEWAGMGLFLGMQIGPDDPQRERVRNNFKRNLNDMVRAGVRRGTPILLSTVASNIRDLGPFTSAHSRGLNSSDLAEFDSLLEKGIALQSDGNYLPAIEQFEKAALIDPLYSELHYRTARAYLALGLPEKALPGFVISRDTDALPFRTDSRLNEIIRDAAMSHQNEEVHLVDSVALFEAESEGKLFGNDFFVDHVHFRNEGNYLLAKSFAKQTVRALGLPTENAARDWPTFQECNALLGFTPWNRISAIRTMLSRLSQPPFSGQLDQAVLARQLKSEIEDANRETDPDAVFPARDLYEAAISKRPDDFRILESYAEFLETTGDSIEAVDQWKRIRDLLPHHFGPYYNLGRLLGKLGDFEAADTHLMRASMLRPDAAVIELELGNNLLRQGKAEQALKVYETIKNHSPEHTEVLLEIARSLALLGRRDEAIETLEYASSVRKNDWEVRYLLGVERAEQGRLVEAQKEFETVVRLRPESALAHLNLGVSLAKQGFVKLAVVEFKEALRLDPSDEHAAQQLQVAETLLRSAREAPVQSQ